MLSLIGFRVIVRQNVFFTIWCKIVKPCPTNGVSINNYRLDISLVVFVYISLSLSFWLSFVHPCCPVEAMVCLESITARTSLSNWLVIDGSIPPATPYTILVFIFVIVLFIIVLHGSILLALTKYW